MYKLLLSLYLIRNKLLNLTRFHSLFKSIKSNFLNTNCSLISINPISPLLKRQSAIHEMFVPVDSLNVVVLSVVRNSNEPDDWTGENTLFVGGSKNKTVTKFSRLRRGSSKAYSSLLVLTGFFILRESINRMDIVCLQQVKRIILWRDKIRVDKNIERIFRFNFSM